MLETVSKILYSFNSYIKVIERSLTDFNLDGKKKKCYSKDPSTRIHEASPRPEILVPQPRPGPGSGQELSFRAHWVLMHATPLGSA